MSHRQHTAALHRQQGFTLSEILVTTAIFAIIMIAALAVYDQSNKVFKQSTEAADMQQATRVGFDKLISDVRMAGFDYNRGGVPTNSWEAPQPDEQIEYAGATAFAFRANFNYNTSAATGNGLEPAITPFNVNGQAIFPYVTTNNSEIVIYALRSTDSTKNTGTISFYVDDYVPREAFPSSITPAPAAGTVSKAEHLLKLSSATCTGCGIDLTNANPPYTLYRITVADVLAGQMGTPIAENIRSLNFKYYTDANGTTLLTYNGGGVINNTRNADGSAIVTANTGAIGGDGQYDPNSVGTTTNFTDRVQRALIQSVRVDLVGMNANPDLQGYTNPAETVTAFQKYREYALSSLVVPRNLGKTGFPEPVYAPPAAPTITGICTGFCAAPVVYWTAPTGGGPVESYNIYWDSSPTGSFGNSMTGISPSVTNITLLDKGLDPSLTYYYKMTAVNSNGSSPYSTVVSAIPLNNTTPLMKTDLHATDVSDSTVQPNKITLTWTSPTDNASSLNTLSCSGTGGSTDGSKIPSVEGIAFRVYRGTTANFDPAHATIVLDFNSTSQPAPQLPGSAITWIDNVTNDQTGPANCVQYYYRVVAASRCRTSGSYNASGNAADSISAPFPAWGSNAIPGQASGGGTPSTPAALVVNGAASACPGGGSPTNCSIQLQWNKVTTDTAGSGIGIDTYRITRYKKHQNNNPSGPCGDTYCLDTAFGSGGSLDVPGYSSLSGSTATYTDTTAPALETSPPFTGTAMSYEYVVAAKECSTYSANSNTADFPAACTINPTIIQCGATGLTCGGATGGDTPASPWIMNAGDQITVQQPAGTTITSVQFNVTNYPSGTAVDSQTVTTGVGTPPGFTYTWSDRVSGAMYQVTMIVTTSTGCRETHIKYVQEATPAACAFPNVTVSPAVANATSGSTTTLSVTYTITNGGTDPMEFHVTSPLFDSSAKVNWADPTSPSVYSDINFTNLTWNTNADNFVAATSPTTRTAPSGFFAPGTNLAAGASFSLTLRYQYSKNDNGRVSLTTNPTQKICISYRIPSEPLVTKFCNLVGQAASTNNPSACD